MPIPGDWIEKLMRQPDERVGVSEGLAKTREASWVLTIKQPHINKELTLFLDDPRLPHYLDPFVSADGATPDPKCRCRTYGIQRATNDKSSIRITYNYSTVPPGQIPALSRDAIQDPTSPTAPSSPTPDSPEDLMPTISTAYEEFPIPMRTDLSPVPKRIVNKAKRFPTPLPTLPAPVLVINYSRFEPTFDWELWFDYAYHVNDDIFNGFNPNFVLTLPWTVETPVVWDNELWYKHNYQFKVHPIEFGWDYLLASMDTHELRGGVTCPILDPTTGLPTSEEWPLDAAGAVILNPVATPPATEQFLTKFRQTFAVLNIVFPW